MIFRNSNLCIFNFSQQCSLEKQEVSVSRQQLRVAGVEHRKMIIRECSGYNWNKQDKIWKFENQIVKLHAGQILYTNVLKDNH